MPMFRTSFSGSFDCGANSIEDVQKILVDNLVLVPNGVKIFYEVQATDIKVEEVPEYFRDENYYRESDIPYQITLF